MSWGRVSLAFCVSAFVSLRWLPHYGTWILVLVALCLLAAGGIYFTQRTRYADASRGIANERIHADIVAVFAMSAAVIGLGILGLWLTLTA